MYQQKQQARFLLPQIFMFGCQILLQPNTVTCYRQTFHFMFYILNKLPVVHKIKIDILKQLKIRNIRL